MKTILQALARCFVSGIATGLIVVVVFVFFTRHRLYFVESGSAIESYQGIESYEEMYKRVVREIEQEQRQRLFERAYSLEPEGLVVSDIRESPATHGKIVTADIHNTSDSSMRRIFVTMNFLTDGKIIDRAHVFYPGRVLTNETFSVVFHHGSADFPIPDHDEMQVVIVEATRE